MRSWFIGLGVARSLVHSISFQMAEILRIPLPDFGCILLSTRAPPIRRYTYLNVINAQKLIALIVFFIYIDFVCFIYCHGVQNRIE